MKMRILFITLLLTIVLFFNSCELLMTRTITINVPEEFVDKINQIIVSISDGNDIEKQTINDITTQITITHVGNIDVIMAYAYDISGILLFTGKGGEGNYNITLDYVGANAASHIVIVQDGLPWGTTSMEDMLKTEGFTEGNGENQYEFIYSSEFSSFDLNPFTDLLIIANDQSQDFYNNIALNNDKINDFIYSGGTIVWEVCDNGWAGGDIKTAGIELPENVTINLLYENYNSIEQKDHKMFTGISDSILYNNYASHEYFTNLPANTNILMRGTSSNEPTLVVYSYGAGIVFMTGQPLEHAYVYQPEQMGLILPRLVKLVLGKL